MNALRYPFFILLSLSVLFACTPAFQTTAQLCETSQPVLALTPSYNVLANRENNNYELYFEDFLNSFKDIQSKTTNEDGSVTLSSLSTDEQAVIDFLFAKVSDKMNYVLENGQVVSADNPLDFIESLVAATDEDEVITAFVQAKQQMANALTINDSPCNYSNREIEFFQEDEDFNKVNLFEARLDLVYTPSEFVEEANYKIDQTVTLTLGEDIADTDPVSYGKLTSFSAVDRIDPENFIAEGFNPTKVRQITVKEIDSTENFLLDEDYVETKIGTFVNSDLNSACTDFDNNLITCPEGSVTKEIEHLRCQGGTDTDENETELPDEIGKVEVNAFDIIADHPTLSNLQRFKIEIDYPNNEINVFVSKFGDAILKAVDADNNPIDQTLDLENYTADQILFNPTNCERTAVSRDLFEALTEEEQADFPDGVSVTDYSDTNFDLINDLDDENNNRLDEDGNEIFIEPQPLFTFQGTAITNRQ
jgi:hypothetical protein